jgi:hypothetical protein
LAVTLDDFLTLPLPKRIVWLHGEQGPKGEMSHDKLAVELDTSRQTIIGWESGREPNRFYAKKLGDFSGYPAWVFRRRESEEAAWEMFARRLGSLEAQVADLVTREDLHQGLETLREAIDAAASRGTRPATRKKVAEK